MERRNAGALRTKGTQEGGPADELEIRSSMNDEKKTGEAGKPNQKTSREKK